MGVPFLDRVGLIKSRPVKRSALQARVHTPGLKGFRRVGWCLTKAREGGEGRVYRVGPFSPKDQACRRCFSRTKVRLSATPTVYTLFSFLPNAPDYLRQPPWVHKAVSCVEKSPRPDSENKIELFAVSHRTSRNLWSFNFSQLSVWILKMETNKSAVWGSNEDRFWSYSNVV